MGNLSTYSQNELLDHVLGIGAFTQPSGLYIGLSTADPTDDGSGLAEPSGNGYARKAITFGAASSRAATQSGIVTFDEATGSWGTISYWAIFDAVTSGNMLASGAVDTSIAVGSGSTPSFASGQLVVSFSTGGISTYLANALLDHLLGGSTYTQPTGVYACICEAELTDASTGSTMDELDMTGYARNDQSAGGTDWTTASAGSSSNQAIIDFDVLTSTGETATALCLCDAGSAGNVLFYDNTPNTAISDGATVQVAIGGFVCSIS